MSSRPKSSKHLRRALDQVSELNWKIQEMQEKLEDGREAVLLQIAEGVSTGSRLRDFVTLAGDGHFDPEAYRQYQKLAHLCKHKPARTRQLAVILQRSELFHNDEPITLTSIFLSVLRPVRPKFLFNPLRISIAIERQALFWTEVFYDEGEPEVLSLIGLLVNKRLTIGPLEGLHTPIGPADMRQDGEILLNPKTAVSQVIPIPQTSPEEIATVHELDPEIITSLRKEWTKMKSSNRV